jgi:excisionase family DNA binding protein
LGQDLRQIAQIASGAEVQQRETVLTLIEDLLQLFFWPAASDDYSVPRSFWDSELGRMLALTKFRSYQAKELMSISDAAKRLGVTRPVVYRWLEDRTLSYVRDDATGRTYVVARDVENIVAVARAMARDD